MGKLCSIKSCPTGRTTTNNTNQKSLSFFQAKTPIKLENWKKSLGMDLKKSDYICQLHFKDEHIKMYDRMKINGEIKYIPTLRKVLEDEALPTVEHQFFFTPPEEHELFNIKTTDDRTKTKKLEGSRCNITKQAEVSKGQCAPSMENDVQALNVQEKTPEIRARKPEKLLVISRRCSVVGCDSQLGADPSLTFHRVPLPPHHKGRGRKPPPRFAHVCSKHVSHSAATTLRLVPRNSVENILKPSSKTKKSVVRKIKTPVRRTKKIKVEDTNIVACRVCLSTDARLVAIRETGMEDDFVKLTGVPFSSEDGLPSHLCYLCRAELSKYVSFRDRSQRSQGLLETLKEWGPLKMSDISTIDRNAHKLKLNLTPTDIQSLDLNEMYALPDNASKVEGKVADKSNLFIYSEVGIEIKIEKEGENDATVDNSDLVENEISTRSTESAAGNTDSSDGKKLRRGVKTTKSAKVNKPKGLYIRNLEDFDHKAFEKEYNVTMTVLSEEEQRQDIETRKTRDNYKNCAYRCESCGKGYNFEDTYMNHMSYHNPEFGPFECPICHIRFKINNKLKRHLIKHRIAFTCNDCGVVIRGERSIVKLHHQLHSGRTYKCRYCEKHYRKRNSMFNHMRKTHPSKNIACDECGETFVSAKGVDCHKKRTHRLNPIKLKSSTECETCRVQFCDTAALDKHRRTAPDAAHASCKPCASCGDNCRDENALATHAVECEGRDKLRCRECDAAFPSPSSLDAHRRRKHLSKENYRPPPKRFPDGIVCDTCGKLLKSESAFWTHTRMHLGVRPFVCSECSKAFLTRQRLRIHMRSHTGESVQCGLCDRKYRNPSGLDKHFRAIHSGVRAYVCGVCGKAFGRSTVLADHLKYVHRGERPKPRRRTSQAKKTTLIKIKDYC